MQKIKLLILILILIMFMDACWFFKGANVDFR